LDWIHVTKDCPLCDIFVQATVLGASSMPKGYPGGLKIRKPTLLSRRASDIKSEPPEWNSPDDFMVLGLAECAEREHGGNETLPRALLLPINARSSSKLPGPTGRLVTNPIDWELVKQWLSFCEKEHSMKCTSEQNSVTAGLRFIDCETLQIVPSPEMRPPYITLSYLWSRAGHFTDQDLQDRSLSDGMPLVIADAIQVVKMLGYRYLWVDRYCIPQKDGHEKDMLIYNMDQIYRCATLSVIANGEEDSRYGLPGVGSIVRIAQPTIRLGSEDYTLCWVNIRERVERSEWSKRSWTFQEGLLSTRRLIFTETQVYFQCNEILCMEMVSIPLAYSGKSEFHRLDTDCSWKVFPHLQPEYPESTGSDLYKRIAEYRTRKLTYESDRYKAFQGILQNSRQRKDPVESIYGVPLYRPLGRRTVSKSASLLFGLCWASIGCASRNEVFPSWTWVGWEVTPSGPDHRLANAYLPAASYSPYHGVFSFPMRISVEFADGTSFPWEERYDDILQRSAVIGPPPCLTVSGTVFDAYLSIGQGEHPDGVGLRNVEVSPLPEGWYNATAYFDHPEAGYQGGLTQCLGLICLNLTSITRNSYQCREEIHVLYLSPKEPSSYERIGVGRMEIAYYLGRELVKNPTSITGLNNVRTQTVRIV
jgi:Heterokaryon incompatibility protein (HET)